MGGVNMQACANFCMELIDKKNQFLFSHQFSNEWFLQEVNYENQNDSKADALGIVRSITAQL